MTRVVLIGDSIRMGYEPVVGRALSGRAEVWGPAENGRDTPNVLAHLDDWVISRRPDVVHVNAGLHDIKRPRDGSGVVVPVERYRENLDLIFRRLAEETGATLVWATTTPVNEEWHHERKGFDRRERDVEEYNRVSLELARAHGLAVNDLFALVTEAGRDGLLVPDGAHFNEEGCRLLGTAVAKAAMDTVRSA